MAIISQIRAVLVREIKKKVTRQKLSLIKRSINQLQRRFQLERLNSGLDISGKRVPKLTENYRIWKRRYVQGQLKHRKTSRGKAWFKRLYDNAYPYKAKSVPNYGRLRGRTLAKIDFDTDVRVTEDFISLNFLMKTTDRETKNIIKGNEARGRRYYGGVAKSGNRRRKEIAEIKRVVERILSN